MNDKWQDNLRSRMEQHEEAVPEGLWESIEQRMPSDKNHHLWSRRVITIVASAAAIALLFIVIFTTNKNEQQIEYAEQFSTEVESFDEEIIDKQEKGFQTESQVLIASNQKSDDSDEKISTDEITKTTKDNLELAEVTGATEATAATAKTEVTRAAGATDKTEALEAATKTGATGITDKTKTAESSETTDKTKATSHSKEFDNKVSNDQLLASSSLDQTRTQKGSKLQTNLSMSNMPSASMQTYSGYGTFATRETVDEQYGFHSSYTREEVYTNVEHEQPITLGLTLRYNLNQRWNITGGLSYSLLSSQLRSGGGNYYYDDRQTLHYIGIPLNIAYNFWQNDNFLSYFSVGTHLQKNIAGRLSSNYYIDDKLQSNTKENIISKPLQWSVNSALGIEYKVTDLIGLYAEPGIEYYFKNNSELETIYKDRPFSFNLRLGLRLTFGD